VIFRDEDVLTGDRVINSCIKYW